MTHPAPKKLDHSSYSQQVCFEIAKARMEDAVVGSDEATMHVVAAAVTAGRLAFAFPFAFP